MGPDRTKVKYLLIRQKLLILVAVPLAVIVLLVLVFALLYASTERAVAAVRQPRLAVQASDSLRTVLLDAETGMRDYAFTGKDEFRAPYDRAATSFERHVRDLQSVKDGDAVQRQAATEIASRARRAFSLMRREVALVASGQRSRAVAEIELSSQKGLMDSFRTAIAAYEDLKRIRQDEAVDHLTIVWRVGVGLLVLALLVGLGATATLYLTISRSMAERLERLSANARAYAGGTKPSARLGGNDEIEWVDDSLHEMFDLLDQRHSLLERYELLAENAGDIMLFIDADNRIVEANAAARRAYGYSREEIVTHTFAELHAPSALATMPTMLARARSNETTVYATKQQRRNGAMFEAEVALAAATADGLVVGILRDTTARRLADAAIAASFQQAIEASRLKSEFVATMSHELRTPMNAIIGMNELLFETELNGEQRDYAETVRESSRLLLDLIEDVLDFSKIEAGRMELALVDLDVAATVESAAMLLASKASQKKLSLTTFVDPQITRSVRADSVRLRQILVNLIGNAVKFTMTGGVAVRVALVASDENTSTLRFSVKDTGIGVDSDATSRLFEPFLQIDASKTRQYGGTGLGLSISRRLARLMGGDITVESALGEGSKFTFEAVFPHGFANVGSDSVPIGAHSALIVDDDTASSDVVTGYLSAWGVKATAVRLADACAFLRGRNAQDGAFDVVILGATQTDDDILELGARIKLDPSTSGLNLVLASADGSRKARDAASSVGFSYYLTKPVRRSALSNAVSRTGGPHVTHDVAFDRVRAEVKPLPSRHRHVLVVEDNAVNQRLATQQLKKLGYAVTAAENGRVALDCLSRDSYDLVLMDCQMPIMDGLAATRAIRKNEANGTRLPIVAMTANAQTDDRVDCLAAGMDDYLAKPVQLEVIRAMLERWLPQTSDSGPAAVLESANARP